MNHVFLSYRYETDDHVKTVRNLGEKLKVAGLPVELDQFYIEDNSNLIKQALKLGTITIASRDLFAERSSCNQLFPPL
jgi:hypothetical protein